jgi:thiamine kinase-like enzyme
VQLRDEKGRVVGYAKYGEKRAACKRLRQERNMLSNLPGGVGPELMKFGRLGNGEALLTSALSGKLLRANSSPPRDVFSLLDSLVVGSPVSLEAHPWLLDMRASGLSKLERWFEPLAGRSWPVVIQHGDFVPWNVLRSPDGKLRAVDWEHGALQSFPYLDLTHYVLETRALIYRQTPLKAIRYAVAYLTRRSDLELSSAEAHALVRLTAYDTYQKYAEEGQRADSTTQAWRRALWEPEVYDT